MNKTRLFPILALLGALACADVTQPELQELPPIARGAALRSVMAFDVGVLEWVQFDRMWFPDGRLHADGMLLGPVTGDIEGSAALSLNARLDEKAWAEDEKVGVANGSLSISTAAGMWTGPVVGTFIGEQFFAKVLLHGPGRMTFRGDCDETSPASEILACTGEVLSPRD